MPYLQIAISTMSTSSSRSRQFPGYLPKTFVKDPCIGFPLLAYLVQGCASTMYSIARFQFLQQAFLKFGIVPNNEALVNRVYTENFCQSQNKNHLFMCLNEISHELGKSSWSQNRPFPAKICQAILQFLPSRVNALNAANSAKIALSDAPIGFLVPECIDVVRVMASNNTLAAKMHDFTQIDSTEKAAQTLRDYVAKKHADSVEFLKKDAGLVASYVKAQMTLSGVDDATLNLFQEVYLLGLLAMYWYDIIPTVISIESRVPGPLKVPNQTARLVKRIIDSHPNNIVAGKNLPSGQSAPEWMYFVDRIDKYTEAVRFDALADVGELGSTSGALVNMSIAMKARTRSKTDISTTRGIYIPTQSLLRE